MRRRLLSFFRILIVAPAHALELAFERFLRLTPRFFQVPRVLQLVHVVGYVPCDPTRIHWIDVRVEYHRIEVPHKDCERSQPGLPEVDDQRDVEHALGQELDEPVVEPQQEPGDDHDRGSPHQSPVLRFFDVVEALDALHRWPQTEVVEHAPQEEPEIALDRPHVFDETASP